MTDDIREFVSLSLAREESAKRRAAETQRRRTRNRNWALAGVSVLAAIAFLLGFMARQQASRADVEAMEAKQQALRADAEAVKAKQQALLAEAALAEAQRPRRRRRAAKTGR